MICIPSETTKPSRINSKRKRGWKIADLTHATLAANLCLLSPHGAARGESRKKHKMPIARLIHRLRFHMQKIIYGGRYLGGFGSHGSCAMSLNPDNVHRPIFERISGVLNISQEVNAMLQNNSAQISGQNQPQISHRLTVQPKTPAQLSDCINPAMERAAAIADLIEAAFHLNMANELPNLRWAAQAILFEILDAQAILLTYVDSSVDTAGDAL